jgi:hypothetical protein
VLLYPSAFAALLFSAHFLNLIHFEAKIQFIRMKGIKKNISLKLIYLTRIRFMSSERKTLKVFFSCSAYAHAPAGDFRRAQ